MDLGLANRVALIVGASSGIGAATAAVLAEEGMALSLVGRRSAELDAVADACPAVERATPMCLPCDAGQDGALEAVVERTLGRFGRLDALVVVAAPMGPRGRLDEMDLEGWRHYFEQGLMIAVRACRAALAPMRTQRCGAIVTTSAYSMRASKPRLVAFSASKSAVASLTKNLAVTYGPEGIRANCVAPGVVEKDEETRQALAARYGVPPDKARYEYVRREFQMAVALERAGRHQEFADVIAFLLSARASYVSGAVVNVDGGTDF